MNKLIPTIVLMLFVVVAGFYIYIKKERATISSFEECAAAGYPIMESYPEQCRTPDGRLFVRDVSGETPPTSQNLVSYTNNDYGISFNYSEQYVLSIKEVGNGERAHAAIVLIDKKNQSLPENGEGPTAITIDVYQNNIDKQPLENWLKNSSASNFKLSNGTYTTTTVDGVPAINYRWSGLYEGETTAFLHKQNIVAVSVTYLTPEDQIRSDFSQIINSLQLSDESGRVPELM